MDKPTKSSKQSPTAAYKGNSGARVKSGTTKKSNQNMARDKIAVGGIQDAAAESLSSNTTKVQNAAFLEAFAIVQLNALNELGRFMGMFGAYATTTGLDMAEVAQRHKEPGAIANIQWAIWTLLDDDGHSIQHAAAGMVLQYYWPRWREEGPPELIGQHVERNSPAVLIWRKQVLERDDNRCQHCGSTEQLHAHHIVHWAVAPMLRTVVANGITLCERCHITEHNGQ